MSRAFTLVELIAVLIVLALAMGVLLVPGGPRWGASSRDEAAAAVRSALEQARMHARARGGARVEFGRTIVVVCEGEPRHRATLPAGWMCRLTEPGADESLLLDARGFGPDCDLILGRTDNEHSTAIHLRVLGITGRVYEVRP